MFGYELAGDFVDSLEEKVGRRELGELVLTGPP